ncbi:uncharacterized protein LOC144444966 [Glandiceps talaboti]
MLTSKLRDKYELQLIITAFVYKNSKSLDKTSDNTRGTKRPLESAFKFSKMTCTACARMFAILSTIFWLSLLYGVTAESSQSESSLSSSYSSHPRYDVMSSLFMSSSSASDRISGYAEYLHLKEVIYEFNIGLMTWVEAKRDCQRHGARLAEIMDSYTQDAIANFILDKIPEPADAYWVNGNDKTYEGGWMTSRYQRLEFTAWGPDEPNNGGNYDFYEDCLQLYQIYKYGWNDNDCDAEFSYICQYDVDHDDPCNIEWNIDRTGSDMNSGWQHQVDSPDDCCQSCHNTDGCKAWTFDKRPDSFGNCWLKWGVPEQTYSQCCDSGVIN